MRTACLLALLLPLSAFAEVTSGPKAGDKAPAMEVFVTVGESEGKSLDPIIARKGGKIVVAFVQNEHWTRPMARFLKTLDKDLPAADADIAIHAVWLGEKPDAMKEYLPKAQMSLNFTKTSLGVFVGEKSGPKDWGINTDAHLTVVVIEKGVVKESFAFRSVNETDVKAILKAVVGKK